ncbi:uncharacterized protein BYT42DRAFT_575142 [Radiomyces spectabilis]|uniref:uncharacterized protein n=1 Tax=Radiomyces spectabilis TaxID=64574 RepID=UPI00221F43F1|nr:uncharacterized protein BYT42DRAFT_575142 [Radiomyces spectabilis]KAI8376576.1 hypothetical protein BYT42DRAFT_575142 [Radiomyces spectabilis]
MSQSQDTATQLFTTFIGIVSKFKALVKSESSSTDAKIDTVVFDELKDTVAAMNSKLDEEVESRNDILHVLPLYQHVGGESSPFADMPIRRTVQHLQDASGAPRKWSWELFKILGCDVLKERWEDCLLTTFKKNVKVHLLPAMATWSDLPSQIQNEAVLLLEGGVGVDFPLKACVGNWGARLLMVHAFQKCKVKEAVEPEEGDASYFNGFYRINASAEGRYVLLRVFLYR